MSEHRHFPVPQHCDRTTLSLVFDLSTKVPLLDKAVDHTAWHTATATSGAYLADDKHNVET